MVSTRSSSQDNFRILADLPQREEKENQLKEIKNHLQQERQRQINKMNPLNLRMMSM